jgi:hypothetical protein
MNRRKLAALVLLTVPPTAVGCNYLGVGPAQAQAPACGGNSTVHPAPIDCENTKTVGGIKGSVRLVVDDNGYVMVTAVVQDLTPNTPPPPLFLQVKAHRGISSNQGFEGATDVFDGNTAAVELFMPKDAATGCTSQVDVKIVPGQPTLEHVSPIFRVAAPLVGLEGCGTQPTTVPTTAPVTTGPTSSPTTTVPETSPPPSSGGSTTAPTATSVVGGTLPATGSSGDELAKRLGLVAAAVGAVLILAARRRSAS